MDSDVPVQGPLGSRGNTLFAMTLRAVVLDMDGVILDTEPLYKAAWQQAAAELGFDLDDALYATLIGRPTDEGEVELLARFGPQFPMPQFRERWQAVWRRQVEEHGIVPKSGLLPFLSFVEAQGLAMAIATSSDAGYAEFSLRSAGLADRFPIVVTCEHVARGKPAPDIYLEAARRLRVDPAECVALEDSDAGVLAASAAGMAVLCVPDLKPPSAAATRAATRVLASLDEARQWIAAAMRENR